MKKVNKEINKGEINKGDGGTIRACQDERGQSSAGELKRGRGSIRFVQLHGGTSADVTVVTTIEVVDTLKTDGTAAYREIFGLNSTGIKLKEKRGHSTFFDEGVAF